MFMTKENVVKQWPIAILTAILIASSGCSGEEKVSTGTPILQITNYTYNAAPHLLKFSKIPKQVIVCGNSTADTLIALGVGDRIKVLSLSDASEKETYQQILPHAVITNEVVSREEAIMQKPDFIVGWRRFFGTKQLGDTVEWGRQGIPAYIQEASGPIPALGNFPPCTIDSEKIFISHMGQIFHKEEEADVYLNAIDEELQKGRMQTMEKKPKVLVLEFMGHSIEVFGKELLSGDIISQLGGDVVFFNAPFVSREELLTADADVIFVVYHGYAEEGQRMVEQIKIPMYHRIHAVQNGRVFPLAYSSIVAPGIHTVETIQYMRDSIFHENNFQ